MTDTLRLLAQVSHNQAEAAAKDLESVADKQEANLKQKEKLRGVEKLYDNITADDVVTFDELQTLHEMREWVGTTNSGFWGSETVNEFEPHELGFNPWKYDKDKIGTDEKHGNNSHFYLELKGDSKEAAKVKEIFDNIKDEIKAGKEKVDDDQSQVQFQIQVGTSDLQNAENVRSQAEKRLETQRKDLTRNWGG